MATYAAEVLADSPRLVLAMDEASGALTDAIGSKTVTIGGTLSYGATGPVIGHTAVGFNGTTTYLSLADHADFDFASTAQFTVELWFRRTGRFATNYAYLFSKGGQMASEFDTTDALTADNDAAVLAKTTSTFPSTDTTWHHYVWAHDGSSAPDNNLYIDGTDVTTSNANNSASANAIDLFIGRYSGGSFFFQGEMAYFAIYPTKLSSTRVAAHYAARNNASGTAASSFGFSTSATGTVGSNDATGTAASAFGFSTAVTAAEDIPGTGASAFPFATAGTGVAGASGVAASAFGFSTAVTAAEDIPGVAASAFGFSTAVTAAEDIPGSGASAFAWASALAGTMSESVTGLVASAFGWSTAGVGEQPIQFAGDALGPSPLSLRRYWWYSRGLRRHL